MSQSVPLSPSVNQVFLTLVLAFALVCFSQVGFGDTIIASLRGRVRRIIRDLYCICLRKLWLRRRVRGHFVTLTESNVRLIDCNLGNIKREQRKQACEKAMRPAFIPR